jgi:hypothetical protein
MASSYTTDGVEKHADAFGKRFNNDRQKCIESISLGVIYGILNSIAKYKPELDERALLSETNEALQIIIEDMERFMRN